MKIGAYVIIFGDYSLKSVLDKSKALGTEAVEIPAGGFAHKKLCDPEKLLKDSSKLKNFLKTIKSKNLIISALNASGNVLHPDKAFAESSINDLKQAVEFAGKTGIPVVNTFGGCPGADESSKIPNWITTPWPTYYADAVKWQWEKKLLPFWNKMAKFAKKHNVKFGFEMHPGDMIYNTELLLMLREKVGMEEISCNFDPSHLFWQGIDPLAAIKRLGSTIVHVHAKDTELNSDIIKYRGVLDWKKHTDILDRAWSFRTVGYGHGPEFWNNFASTLKKVGYDYVISIEHEDLLMSPNEGLHKAISLLKRAVIFE